MFTFLFVILHHIKKKATQMNQRPKCKTQNYKLLEETKTKLHDTGFCNGFLSMTSKALAIKQQKK